MQPYFTEALAWQRITALRDAAATGAAAGAGAADGLPTRRERMARRARHSLGAVWPRSGPAASAATAPCVC